MKRIAVLAVALILGAGSVFAQGAPKGAGDRPAGPGWGPMGGIDWKVGTVVTIEDKKLTGTLVLGERVEPVLKADGVEYILALPTREWGRLNVKNGDTMSVEGLVVTVKSDSTVPARVHPFTATIAGKDYDLRPHRWNTRMEYGQRGPGMMGPGSDRPGDDARP